MTAIRVENLSKHYHISHSQLRNEYRTLRDTITDIVAAPFRQLRHGAALGKTEEFWALRDISFEVEPGEVIGIIGRNGAGKSTLLKILSQITPPTRGRAILNGRVGSLLEVGTGFHPELTGRENIYLNGSILGMSKREIDQKFDEIVDFSGVERFLDTPIKRYSSGMKVRLAFAVAAHLEPEILIVDEVLAVGDAEFQKKCLGKMEHVAHSGRTVLFVSHNMASVQNLCRRLLVVNAGKVEYNGATEKGIEIYFDRLQDENAGASLATARREEGLSPVIRNVSFYDAHENPVSAIPAGESLLIRIDYEHTEPMLDPTFGIIVESSTGIPLFWLQTRLQQGNLPDLPAKGSAFCRVPRVPLVPSTYFLTLGCASRNQQLDRIKRACKIQVTANDVFGTGRLQPERKGMFLVEADWDFSAAAAAVGAQ